MDYNNNGGSRAGTSLCPFCGKPVPDGANVCEKCGKKLPQEGISYCVYCGTEIPSGEDSCKRCKKPVPKPGERKCKKCGNIVPAGKSFCGKCGEPLPPVSKKYHACGAEIPEGAIYCSNCGNPINDNKPNKIAIIITAVLVVAAIILLFCFAGNKDDVDEAVESEEVAQKSEMEIFMEKFPDGVSYPDDYAKLDYNGLGKYYVKSYYGEYTDVYECPDDNSSIIGSADEEKLVTVYATQGDYALGIVDGYNIGGWFYLDDLSEEYYPGPNPSDIKNLDSRIGRPTKDDYLDDYETMYVKSKHGKLIYLILNPVNTTEDDVVSNIYEREEVTVLARRNGFAFVIVSSSGLMGWCNAGLLVYDY